MPDSTPENDVVLPQMDTQVLLSIMNGIADPIFVKDREHRWIMLNDAFCLFMGHQREELLGKSDYEFFPAAQADVFWRKDEEVFASGKENINEEQFTDARGVEHTIVTKKSVFRDQAGKLTLVGVIHDVSAERKREEELLHLAEIVQSTDDAIIARSLDGTITAWNGGAERLYGYKADEVIGKSMWFFESPEEEADFRRKFDAAKNGTVIQRTEVIRNRKDGTLLTVAITLTPMRDTNGAVTGVSSIAHDISALKVKERELEEMKVKLEQEAKSAQKFLQAVEASSTATVITTTEPTLIYANPAWEKLTGYSEQEAIGHNPRVLKSGRTPASLYPQMWNTILSNREFWTDDIINKRKDGTEYNADLRIYPIVEDGVVKYFVGMQRDITSQKRSDLAKTEFMSLASHQLRTPLTAIRWGLTMIRNKGPLNPIQEDILKDLEQSSIRMAESIDVMLQLSRIEAGKVSVQNAAMDVGTFIADLCQEFGPAVTMKGHVIDTDIQPGMTVMTDAALVREILANLLSNAIKYTPQGGKLTIGAKIIDGKARFSVTDTGMGIPADQQHLVFSRFFRASNVANVIPDGTGLGLYLVYALSEILGGNMTFVSMEKRGTTFTLTLPLTPPPSPRSHA